MQQGLGITGQCGEVPGAEQQFALGPRFLQGEAFEGWFTGPAFDRRQGHDRQPGPPGDHAHHAIEAIGTDADLHA